MATGTKHDSGKPRMDLLCPQVLLEVGAVLEFGARKYSPNGWRSVPDLKARYTAAALRHMTAHMSGESVDAESGLSHLAHALCCLMFLRSAEITQ